MQLGMELGLSPGDFVLDGDPAPLYKKGAKPPQIFDPCLLWPNGWMDQDGTWHGGRPQPWRLCVTWPQKGGAPPQFSANLYCAQTAGCITVTLGKEVGLSPGDFVSDEDPAIPPQKGGAAPSPIISPCLLWPNVWMDQDGTLHGGGPWSRPHSARWGTRSAPQKRGQSSPILGPFLLSPNGWMNQGGTWHGGGPSSKPHCTRWGPRPPPPKRDKVPQFSIHFCCRQTAGWIKMALSMAAGLDPGDFVFDGDPATPEQRAMHPPPPSFWSMFIVAKRLDG